MKSRLTFTLTDYPPRVYLVHRMTPRGERYCGHVWRMIGRNWANNHDRKKFRSRREAGEALL